MTDSNTSENSTEKPKRKGQFQKGDPRINRNGRPKTADELRSLSVSILHEIAVDGQGNPIIIMAAGGSQHKATNMEMVMRRWLKDPKRDYLLIERAFGKLDIGEGQQPPVTVVIGIDPTKI